MKLKKLLRHCNKTKKIFFKRYGDGITYLSSGDVMAQLNYNTDLTVKSVLEYLEIDDDAAGSFITTDDYISDIEFDRHIQKSDERLEALGLAIEIENELCRTFRTPRGLLLLPDKYLDIFAGKYSEYYLRGDIVLRHGKAKGVIRFGNRYNKAAFIIEYVDGVGWDYLGTDYLGAVVLRDIEIISNIHDTPELLEEDDE